MRTALLRIAFAGFAVGAISCAHARSRSGEASKPPAAPGAPRAAAPRRASRPAVDKVRAGGESSPVPPARFDELLRLAESAFSRGDERDSEAALDEADRLKPEDPGALEIRGAHRYRLGRSAEARILWLRALKVESRPAERRALGAYLAEIESSSSRPRAAADAEVAALLAAGRRAESVEDWPAAQGLYLRALALDPDDRATISVLNDLSVRVCPRHP